MGDLKIEVTDATGRLVQETSISKDAAFLKSTIDLSNEDSGMYFLKYYSGEFTILERLIVE